MRRKRVQCVSRTDFVARILIVDDEPPMRELLRRLVAPAGHDVIEAGTAEDAVAALSAGAVDVAFCDVEMPGKGGLWLTNEIRRRHAATAVVLATGVASLPPAISLKAGVVAYLLKPFDRAQVMAALHQALAWHEQALIGGDPDGAESLKEWLDGLDR